MYFQHTAKDSGQGLQLPFLACAKKNTKQQQTV
eukprot:SAG31_NODE_23960_length_492_cov_0.956743_2_plen_32_part_01